MIDLLLVLTLGRMSYVVELFPSTVGILAALLPRTLLHEGKEGACNNYHILGCMQLILEVTCTPHVMWNVLIM